MREETGGGGARVALVHDFLVDVRGAERVFRALCDLFPAADLLTAVYGERGTEGRFAARRDALAAAVASFDPLSVGRQACARNAERFDVAHFRHGVRAVVDRALAADRPEGPTRRRPPRRPVGLAWQA